MAKSLAGVVAVSIAALLFAGCGGGSSSAPTTTEATTTTTIAKTVVSSFCKERRLTLEEQTTESDRIKKAGLPQELTQDLLKQTLFGSFRFLNFVWSDGSVTESEKSGSC